MGDGHAHQPAGAPPKDYLRSLKIAIVITSLFLVVEVAGGFLAGSLALISDAGHMFSDVLALLLSLVAMVLAQELPTRERTYGYHRAEIFAAFINALLLIAVSAVLLYEAVLRLMNPAPVAGGLMLLVAVAGFGANAAIIVLLHGSSNVNVRSAFLHVVGDTVSSIGVIVGAAWISLTGQTVVDPVLSLVITVVIIVTAARILRETAIILLQFTPPSVDFDAVVNDMTSVPGVDGVHHVHLWSLCSDINVLDAHVYSCERDVARIEGIKEEIKERLKKYRILHSTLEFECEECEACSLVAPIATPPHA